MSGRDWQAVLSWACGCIGRPVRTIPVRTIPVPNPSDNPWYYECAVLPPSTDPTPTDPTPSSLADVLRNGDPDENQ